jgi:hypothetical protein
MCRNSFRDIILMLVELEVRNWKICKAFDISFEELKEMIESERSKFICGNKTNKGKS